MWLTDFWRWTTGAAVATSGTTAPRYTATVGPRHRLTVQTAPRYVVRGLTLGPRLAMSSISPDRLTLGADTIIHLTGVTVFDPPSGTRIAATGIALTGHIATTPTGATIHASLSKALTEIAAGEFYALLAGADVETHARTYLGDAVFLVLQIANGVYLGHKRLPVVDGVRLAS